MFQAKNDGGVYELCGDELSQQAESLTKHGEFELAVHGQVIEVDSGDQVLCLKGFSVGVI
jgi:hypothetical protein